MNNTSGKWIIRITLVLGTLTAMFWCTWALFAPIPNSLAVSLPFGREIPSMPRSADFIGIILLGWCVWSADRQRRKSIKDGERFRLFLALEIVLPLLPSIACWLTYYGEEKSIGVLAGTFISLTVYLALRLAIWYLPQLWEVIKDGYSACAEFCRDFAAALRRTPTTH